MEKIEQLREFAYISQLTKPFTRHPEQLNRCHEADAELVLQPDGSYLAATVDTLYEEYHLGLIRDPRTLGWTVVMQSLSDLAAVAADPIGVLLAITLPKETKTEWTEAFFAGAHEALTHHGTFCLGGDTAFGADASFSCTALGRIPAKPHAPPVLRTGAKAGDLLYITGPLGSGNLLAISAQVDKETWKNLEAVYRPIARLREARALSSFVRCGIDTSDALLQALAILGALNHVGIEFNSRDDLYDIDLRKLVANIRFPLWLVNVFGLGEYELVWAIDPTREQSFLHEAQAQEIPVTRIGTMTAQPGIRMREADRLFDLDVPYLLNLYGTCASIPEYLQTLVTYDAQLRGKA